VTDPAGAEASTTTAVTVFNVAPSVAAFAGAALVTGETYSASGSFTDPGADTWTATVDYGDGSGQQPLSLSGQSFALSHTYAAAGSFTVTVAVTDDDGGVSTKTATVTVLSSRQALANLQSQVNAVLNGGAANSLNAKLSGANMSLARGNTESATGQIGAFINEVRADVQSGRLSQAQGDALMAYAQRILDSIG
jgi:hypothetical protein